MTTIIQNFLKELEAEAQTTRKMLSRIPDDKYDWKPHEKSMTVRLLAVHIAELPAWVAMALQTSGLDFASTPYEPTVVHNTAEVLELLEKSLSDGLTALKDATDEQLQPQWVLRSGDQVLYEGTKGDVVRMSISQIIHHRAQLGVYLRLLNIPIPGSYGPSADEMEMMQPAAV
jgi:uncharacterized damage-inducible protein DinB